MKSETQREIGKVREERRSGWRRRKELEVKVSVIKLTTTTKCVLFLSVAVASIIKITNIYIF